MCGLRHDTLGSLVAPFFNPSGLVIVRNFANTSSSARVLAVNRGRERERARATAYDGWSIGIYTGASPFKLNAPSRVRNPVLTSRDVSDVRAAFVADPFMIKTNGSWT